MHRYPSVGGGNGVGNNASGGVSREAVRPELGFSASSLSLNARRHVPLTPYTLKCDQEPLSARLGPPDYFPPTPNCAEESLSRDACQNGYKETVDGIEESRETSFTLINQQVWAKPVINKYKEAIRRRLNALNNSLLRKRKAGQVYGVPLSGPLLAKPGQFPEQRSSGENNRKKWIEDLAQHKRLKVLADYVPHGLRKRSLFESLVKNEVPFLRATWCIKVTYLNQVRPLSIGLSGGGGDKSQQKRVELWTKDLLEYMQSLLDELCQNGDVEVLTAGRENCAALPINSATQQLRDFPAGSTDGEELPVHKKWHYMYRLLQLHVSEGLLHRAQVIDWVLKQLQEREKLDAVELILPIVLDLIDDISTCQTLVRTVVDIFLHKLQVLCPAHNTLDAAEQARQCHAVTFFTELLSYLITAVPDSFVALDCFPLPGYVFQGRTGSALVEDAKEGAISRVLCEKATLRREKPKNACEVGVKSMVDVIQKKAMSLAKAVNPSGLTKNEGSVIQCLDKAIYTGDVVAVYKSLFEEDFCGHEHPPDEWLSKIAPCLKLGSIFTGDTNITEIFSVRFLCEWAVCDFRDCRKVLNTSMVYRTINLKTACKIYMAVSILCLRSEQTGDQKSCNNSQVNVVRKGKIKSFANSRAISLSSFFNSPGPIHDNIVMWLDQHDLRRGDGFESLQLLLWELVKKGLFWPPAYVRKLLISGVLEKKETPADIERALRHRCILQHLPWPPGLSLDDDGGKILDPIRTEAIRIHRNERRFCLSGSGQQQPSLPKQEASVNMLPSQETRRSVDGRKLAKISSCTPVKARKLQRKKMKVMDLKQAIAKYLHFPDWCLGDEVGLSHDKLTSWQTSLKRKLVPQENLMDKLDGTPGCEECSRNKKQKNNDGISVFPQSYGICSGDETDMWWAKKLAKPLEKTEPVTIMKPPKQPSRGRPKAVRKLSLAQLDAVRIEASQGASSSHTCDNKVNCPYHKSAVEETIHSRNQEKKESPLMPNLNDIITMLKRLQLSDRRAIAAWLDVAVRNLLEGNDKFSSVSSSLPHPAKSTITATGNTAADDRASIRWHFEEEELAAVLCLMDTASDFCSLISLLLWLLPKASVPSITLPGQNYRSSSTSSSRSKEFPCKINESVILTSLRRYEGILLATNLLPEAFSVGMQRAALLMIPGSSNRACCASIFAYIRDLYKKYKHVSTVQLWEKNWKACTDQRMINELDLLKSCDNETSFPLLGVNSPNLGDDRDDSLPPGLVARQLKFGPHMRDHVRRGFQEVINQLITKEREISVAGISRDNGIERWGEGIQAAEAVANGVLEFIKQQAGANLSNGDMQLAAAAAAVSAVVSSAGNAAVGVFENLASNNSYFSASSMAACVKCTRWILQAHIQCLRYLKEAFCEKQIKVLEFAFATEATAVISSTTGHSYSKAPRPQFQLSPETPDPSSTLNELGAGSNGFVLGRSNTAAAAMAALVICAVLDDIISLEKVISLLRIKEGLDNSHLSKASSLSTNGVSRVMSTGSAMKSDNVAEMHLFWFRVLIGDCRSIASGLLAELLGESNILSLQRMQRLLPLALVFSPAYSLFSVYVRSQQSSIIFSNRDDTSLLQLIHAALVDLVVHDPFCEICLQDTKTLVDLIHSDSSDVEYASFLDSKGVDAATKLSSMVPSRPRMFLHAILDHKLPTLSGDESYMQQNHGTGNTGKNHGTVTEQLLQVLDDIHPATFHWQWVELRFLLNEQIFMDKFEAQNVSLAAEAMQTSRSAIMDKQNLSDTEKNFTDMILTRLLVRPDAAALYSEALQLLGKAFEEYLILQVQWILENRDVVLGKKFLRQQLEEVAHRRKFKLASGKFKVWEWVPPQIEMTDVGVKVRKAEVASPEEGEVAEDDLDCIKQHNDGVDLNGCCAVLKQQFAIEKALADLVLPCLARSTVETRNRFALRLVKQITDLEQDVTRSSGQSVVATSETIPNKRLSSRKGSRVGSDSPAPGIGRKTSSVTDSSTSSVAALQTSLWLRLQFLLPLLPAIYIDRDPGRNMRTSLTTVILRLLGTRFVQETVETFCFIQQDSVPAGGCDSECNAETSATAAAVMAGENLFDRLLSVLHALLSSTWASWLKSKSAKSRPPPPFDREIIHRMQVDLDHMQIPALVRERLQAAMPVLAPAPTAIVSAGPPQVPAAALPVIQMAAGAANSASNLSSVTGSYKVPIRLDNNFGKAKLNPVQDLDTEIDPWTLLEDVTGSSSAGTGGVLVINEGGSSKACAWLKGAVRVRRTNLTYVGSVDDDS